jgi:hemerythrin
MFKNSDLIIMDLDNYDVDVVALITSIKADVITKEIPIILLSSQSDLRTLKKAIKAGCTDFVTKPFSNEVLIEKVHKLTKLEFTSTENSSSYFDERTEMPEANMKWSEHYEIGIEEIDNEHKEIIINYEKLYELMKKGLGHEYYEELVAFLTSYVNNHFAHEEAFQESINYDKHSQHIAYHQLFKEKVEQIIASHDKKTVTNLDLIKINLFIKDWLIHHILVEDRKIGEFLENIGKENKQ